MTTINETVQQSMAAAGLSGYTSHVAPVVTALVNREQEIVGNLIQFAQNSDLNVDEVRRALEQAGLQMPPAPAVQATQASAFVDPASGEGDLAGTLTRIEQALTGMSQTVQGLVGFARQNGYSG